MGAVVSFIEDVGNAVGDVFEAVGDVVEDVGNAVADVVEKVGDVVQKVIDDPLPVLLSVAGSFVGIPPAITMGAITAARGGDLEDIALSMGTAYFAPQVGSALSSTVSSAFIDAGFNEAFTEVASTSISKGLVNGTVAEIKGGSFEDGFAGGFTGGMVAGGVGEVGSYVKDDVISLAQESGLDLKDATSLYNAGTKAFSSGITAEVTGRGDFATSFANSAVGSGVDAGSRSLNSTIDEQFATAAFDWNKQDKTGETIDTASTGAGIPNEIVGEVTVSGYGVDNLPDTIDNTVVLADSGDAGKVNNDTSSYAGEKAVSDIAVLPETQLAEAPVGETEADFAELMGIGKPVSSDVAMSDTSGGASDVPESVIDIAEALPPEETPAETPVGGLTAMTETVAPVVDLDTSKPAVVSEAPIAENLLTEGLALDQPVGGLNAVSQPAGATPEATPEAKMATSMGLKATDITKPLVATAGSLFKQALTQRKPPTRSPARPARPAGGLQTARSTGKPTAPPKMDVAKLIPIQKAIPNAPPKTLASTAKLSPVSNIAGLTSLVKKTG
jgi:hypothetical protein